MKRTLGKLGEWSYSLCMKTIKTDENTKAIIVAEMGIWNIDRADGVRLLCLEGTKPEAIEIAEMYCRMYHQAIVVEHA